MTEHREGVIGSRQFRAIALAAWPAATLALGLLLWLVGVAGADWIWAAGVVPVLVALVWQIVVSLRRGEVGLDIVALLSMAGSLILGETLAGNVVALMYAGGGLLEAFAEGRARREMQALLARAPKSAMRYEAGGLREVAIEAVMPGDRLLVRAGDTVAADGSVAVGETALLDQSALTGEALPVRRRGGEAVLSGSVNAADAFDLDVTRPASESAFGAIVRLVEAAQAAKAPMSRMADRFAIWFLLLTVAIAGAAWLATGDPVRALAVLVVATPCPLILAVPVAIASGLSLAAKRGVLVKGGGVLERLAGVTNVVIDKTGTVTHGQAGLVEARCAPGISEVSLLAAAASLEQASNHVIAEAIVAAARDRGVQLSPPQDVVEAAGDGLEGSVAGRRVVVGNPAYVARKILRDPAIPPEGLAPGHVVVDVAIDGAYAGTLLLADAVRAEAGHVLAAFRERGVKRIVLATGDSEEIAHAIGSELGVDEVLHSLVPADKVEAVKAERRTGITMMIGDGVNDAPALAVADVGIAMGARGAAPSSEAADAVLLVDRLDRVVEAIDIARRSRNIALESVYVGIGLSLAAMVVAAFGYLPPVAGALLQEVIDVAVILNALRALWPGKQPDNRTG